MGASGPGVAGVPQRGEPCPQSMVNARIPKLVTCEYGHPGDLQMLPIGPTDYCFVGDLARCQAVAEKMVTRHARCGVPCLWSLRHK